MWAQIYFNTDLSMKQVIHLIICWVRNRPLAHLNVRSRTSWLDAMCVSSSYRVRSRTLRQLPNVALQQLSTDQFKCDIACIHSNHEHSWVSVFIPETLVKWEKWHRIYLSSPGDYAHTVTQNLVKIGRRHQANIATNVALSLMGFNGTPLSTSLNVSCTMFYICIIYN